MYSVRDDKVKSFKSFKQSDLLSLFDAMGHQVDPKCIPQGCNPQEMKKCVESLSMPPYIKDDICNMLSYIDNNQGIKQYCMKPEKFGGPNKEDYSKGFLQVLEIMISTYQEHNQELSLEKNPNIWKAIMSGLNCATGEVRQKAGELLVLFTRHCPAFRKQLQESCRQFVDTISREDASTNYCLTAISLFAQEPEYAVTLIHNEVLKLLHPLLKHSATRDKALDCLYELSANLPPNSEELKAIAYEKYPMDLIQLLTLTQFEESRGKAILDRLCACDNLTKCVADVNQLARLLDSKGADKYLVWILENISEVCIDQKKDVLEARAIPFLVRALNQDLNDPTILLRAIRATANLLSNQELVQDLLRAGKRELIAISPAMVDLISHMDKEIQDECVRALCFASYDSESLGTIVENWELIQDLIRPVHDDDVNIRRQSSKMWLHCFSSSDPEVKANCNKVIDNLASCLRTEEDSEVQLHILHAIRTFLSSTNDTTLSDDSKKNLVEDVLRIIEQANAEESPSLADSQVVDCIEIFAHIVSQTKDANNATRAINLFKSYSQNSKTEIRYNVVHALHSVDFEAVDQVMQFVDQELVSLLSQMNESDVDQRVRNEADSILSLFFNNLKIVLNEMPIKALFVHSDQGEEEPWVNNQLHRAMDSLISIITLQTSQEDITNILKVPGLTSALVSLLNRKNSSVLEKAMNLLNMLCPYDKDWEYILSDPLLEKISHFLRSMDVICPGVRQQTAIMFSHLAQTNAAKCFMNDNTQMLIQLTNDNDKIVGISITKALGIMDVDTDVYLQANGCVDCLFDILSEHSCSVISWALNILDMYSNKPNFSDLYKSRRVVIDQLSARVQGTDRNICIRLLRKLG